MASRGAEKLERLLKQQEQLKAQIALLQAREKEEERKKDTRRKILLGGIILAKVKRGEWPQAKLVELLDRELTEERDRVLFDLPPISKEAGSAPPDSEPTETPPRAHAPE